MFLFQSNPFSQRSLIAAVLVMSLLLVSGCTHQNLIKSGQGYFTSQHYELAVEQFEQALAEKPNHQPTIEQLQQAKKALNHWASQLEIKADHANNAGQSGKAMLLYSKVAQLTQSSHSIEQYKKIHNTLLSESAIRAELLPNNVGITPNDIANIDGLTLTGNSQQSVQLSFKKSNPIFEIQQSSLTKKAQYVSGTQMAANPEFSEIQHQISHSQNNTRNLRDELSEARHQLNQNNNQLSQFKNQQQSIEQRQLRSDLPASEQKKYRSQLEQLKAKIVKLEKKVASSQHHVDKYKHQLSHNRNELSLLIDRLAYTPAVVAVPVYSDYHYQVQRQHNSLVGQLYLTHFTFNNSTRAAQVSVSSQDDSHPEHPTIGLNADPMLVKNQQQLTELFNIEIKQIAKRLLTELVDERRHQFLRQANQTTDISHKFSLWVNHGMVSKEGALPQIAQKIQQTLIMEYGVGGEFDVNQLLHRYQ